MKLYPSTRILALLIALTSVCGAATTQTIFNFPANGSGGKWPRGPLVADAKGNYYGVTSSGGLLNRLGTVFQVSPGPGGVWTETVIHYFKGSYDGSIPQDGLLMDVAGNLYGATLYGGSSVGSCTHNDCGTIFKMSPDGHGGWTKKTIYKFNFTDGFQPHGSLVMDKAGNLYGTTTEGGPFTCNGVGCGTVFRLSKNANGTWTNTVLHSFAGQTDGSRPSPPVLDTAGNIYGTASGGSGNCGIVFKLTNPTWAKSVLHSFQGSGDGCTPSPAPVVLDSAGNLYGTTESGGGRNTQGVVFQLAQVNGAWTENVLQLLGTSGMPDASQTGLIFDSGDNLFGSTFSYIFELSPSSSYPWTQTILSTTESEATMSWNTTRTGLVGLQFGGVTGDGYIFEITLP